MTRPAPRDVAAAYAAVQRAADADVLRILRDAYRDVNGQISRLPRGDLRRDRLLAIKQSLLLQQSEIFEKVGKVIEARRTQAAARAIRVSGRYDQMLFDAVGAGDLGRALSRAMEETEARTVDAAVARLTGSSVPLSARVVRAGEGNTRALERRINSALARGLSAEDFAREIRDFIRPDTPGGRRYAALRIARSEINNAFHAIMIEAAKRKPWITKVKWNLSASHPPPPDECNELAGRLFAPEDTPRKPHPMCLCYITPEVDTSVAAEEEFLDALVSGDMDDFLDQFALQHNL